MMRKLHRHKAEVISDDNEVLEIMARLGLLDSNAGSVPLGQAHASCHAFTQHPTHWLLFVRFHGFANPSENGRQLFAWPKAGFPASVMDQTIAAYSGQSATRWVQHLPPFDPAAN